MLDDQPQLRALVKHYQDAIAHLPDLDLIPPRWLHVTMQGIGFTDEISTAELAAVSESIGERLHGVEPPVTSLHRPTIHLEAVVLEADRSEPLYQLRPAMYDAIATELGPATFGEPRPERGQFTYVNN
jgi:hypothetical protein